MGNSGMIAGAFSSTSGLADTVLTTNGDILYYNSGRQRLAKEDNDDVLTLKSGLPSWEPVSAGATVTAQAITPTNSQTTTSTSLTDIQNCTITSPSRSGGKLSWILFLSIQNDTLNQAVGIGVEIDGSDKSAAQQTPVSAGSNAVLMSAATADLNGNDVVGRWFVGAGTGKISSGSTTFSEANTFEVS